MGATESKEEIVAENTEPKFEPPENDYQLVFEAIKALEYTLMASFESSGDCLHEMIATTNRKLPMDLIVDMRALATTRNNMAHEYSCDKLEDREDFIEKYKRVTTRLNEEIKRNKEEDEQFYSEVVQRHRQLHPRPTFVVEEETPVQDNINASPMACVACF
ncbi:expressed unknown protein [Seminavis robusta]|uniref:DUF4145 domain-containing protein n=1 Tax=Seminavis robusta TaxID=568900 RepID=A0A9N8E6U0_9STRA|nr:expressed unknown protein [Seminavis robusta]|eukprot:Sro684_g186760.1 n/a (161) ;mRNA; f:21560-22042